MKTITREQTRKLIDSREELTVVEVLKPEAFRKFHLPGAKNVPFDESFDTNIQQVAPDKQKPVLVYCQSEDCDASPKAARRMEEMGYANVYDYEAGKADWKDAGLPVES